MAPSHDLDLPADASPDEAAAITAAVEALLAEEARARRDGESAADGWGGRRFGFAGRLEKLGDKPVRAPDGAPTDPWTAAGRLERY